METKQQQREFVKAKKKEFMASTSLSQRIALSQEILSRVESLSGFVKAKVVLAYSSLDDEVYTHSFLDRWFEDKTILLPKVAGNNLTLHPYLGKDSVSGGAFGIDEPLAPCFPEKERVDFVLVPGVAFDSEGNRLGRGRGFYDRLLGEELPETALRVGVCFGFQLLSHVVTEADDVRMHMVVCQDSR